MMERTDRRQSKHERPGEKRAGLAERFRNAEAKGLCPECGRQMDEIDRLSNADSTLIWLKCSADGCNGRWLQQRKAPEVGRRNSA